MQIRESQVNTTLTKCFVRELTVPRSATLDPEKTLSFEDGDWLIGSDDIIHGHYSKVPMGCLASDKSLQY